MRNLRLAWAWWLVGLAIVAGMGIYLGLGLDEYVKARRYLAELAEGERVEAETTFYGSDVGNIYGGILAGIAGNRLWLWGEGGLRTFVLPVGTVYSYHSLCTVENRERIAQGDFGIRPIKGVYWELAPWRERVGSGQYVGVETAGEGSRLAREVHGYDWWAFKRRIAMETVCGE